MKFIKYTTYFKTAILLLVLAVRAAAEEAVPPPCCDPYAIVEAYYEAVGGLSRLKAVRSAYAEGMISYDGLSGRMRSWSERPLRFRVEEDYGIITYVEGDDGFQAWFQDVNGRVLLYRDDESLKRRMIKALLEDYEHLKRDSQWFSLTFDGIRTIDSHTCLVVKMTNTINSDITRYFFDADTLLLLFTIEKQPDIEIQTAFSNYHLISGIQIPFETKSHISPRDKEIVVQLHKYEIDTAYLPQLFAVPQGVIDYAFDSAEMAKDIPFEFVDDSIFLPVTILGDTRLWAVDTGASGTVIDADYAESIGLRPESGIKGFGFGEHFEISFVKIPGYGVRGVKVGHQRIMAVKGVRNRSYEPEIVGILGYDFLSRFVVKIDYARQTISFYDPVSFSYKGDGVIVNAPLKYNTFSLPVVLNHKDAGRFSLDTGAFHSKIYWQFAQKHDLLGKKGIKRAVSGLNGAFLEKDVRFASLKVAGIEIKDVYLSIPLEPGKGMDSSGELAGNLGNSILKHFVVYLDYDRQQVILEKGLWFHKRFKRDEAGVTVGISENGSPIISYVDNASPGFRAGLRIGDHILAVNGIKVQALNGTRAIKEILRKWPSISVQLTVKRGHKRLHVYL